jgi:hypothetical protein
MQKYTVNAQRIIYVNCPKETLKGKFTVRQRGPQKRRPRVLKTKPTSGSNPLRSDVSCEGQWEAGPREGQLKTLKGELENNSR